MESQENFKKRMRQKPKTNEQESSRPRKKRNQGQSEHDQGDGQNQNRMVNSQTGQNNSMRQLHVSIISFKALIGQFNNKRKNKDEHENNQQQQDKSSISDQYQRAQQQQRQHREEQQEGWMNNRPKKKYELINEGLKQRQKYKDGKILFPHQPYSLQLKYMHHIQTGLDQGQDMILECPTGSGKTLSLLASVLGWVHYDNQSKKTAFQKINKIIYTSRSHSQLEQIQKQIKESCFRPDVVILGSRKKLCVHEKVYNEQQPIEQLKKCNQFVKNNQIWEDIKKDPALFKEYQLNQKEFKQIEENKCGLFLKYQQRKTKSNTVLHKLSGMPITINDQKKTCLKEKICPYFYPSVSKFYCNLALMPYNYLSSKKILSRNSSLVENSIIIFDEGHNILDAMCQGMNIQFSASYFNYALSDLTKIIKDKEKAVKQLSFDADQLNYFQISQEQQEQQKKKLECWKQLITDSEKAKEILLKLTKNLQQYCQNKASRQRNRRQSQITQFICSQGIASQFLKAFMGDESSHQKFQQLLIQVSRRLQSIFNNVLMISDKKYGPFIVKNCADFLLNIKDTIYDQEIIKHFSLFITYKYLSQENKKQKKQKIKIRLLCFNPQLMFNTIKKLKPKSIIITSGTLSPLDSWDQSTGLNLSKFSNKSEHVITPNQCLTVIVSKCNQKQIHMVKNENEIDSNVRIAYQTISIICNSTPFGVLVVLASKDWKKRFQSYYESIKNTDKKLNKDEVIFEDQTITKDLGKFMEQLKKYCKQKKGFVIFSVCRGSLSQGIDFKDDMCRAVVMVGVPLKNVFDPILIQQKRYHDRMKRQNRNLQSGKQWQQQQIIRATNQSIGRVIRGADDYGIIYLVDDRYEKQFAARTQRLSQWALRRHVRDVDATLIPRISQDFFKLQEKQGRKKV